MPPNALTSSLPPAPMGSISVPNIARPGVSNAPDVASGGKVESVSAPEGFDAVAEAESQGLVLISKDCTFVTGGTELLNKPLVDEQPKPSEGRGLESPTEARDLVFEACRNFKRKYVDIEGVNKLIAACSEAVVEVKDEHLKAALMEELQAFRATAERTIAAREKILRFVPDEPMTMKNLNPSREELDKVAQRQLKDAKVALRNLAFDLKLAHGQLSPEEEVSFGFRNFFSTTRNPVFRFFQNKIAGWDWWGWRTPKTDSELLAKTKDVCQAIGSGEILKADELGDTLSRLATDILSKAGAKPPDGMKAAQGHIRESMEDLRVLREGVSWLADESPQFMHHLVESMTDTLKEMCHGNSRTDFVLSVHAGAIVPIPVAKLEAGMEAKYAFSVTTKAGSDRVTISRVKVGGAQAKGQVGIGEVANVKVKAHLGLGTGEEIEYSDIESAVQAIVKGKLGPLTALAVKGVDVGYILKSAGKFVTSRPSKSGYKQDEMLLNFRDRGLLKDVDAMIGRHLSNPRLVSDREYLLVKGGLEGSAKARFGFAQMQGELSGEMHGETHTIRRDFHSYYAYFTTDRIGEAATVYGKLPVRAGDVLFESEENVKGILNREVPDTADGKKAFVTDVIDEMTSILKTKDKFASKEAEQFRRANEHTSASSICAGLRRASVALVAMEEKARPFLDGLDAETREAFDKALNEVRVSLEKPYVPMTKEQLADELYVTRCHTDDRVVTTGHFFVSANLVTEGVDSVLSNTAISNSGGNSAGVTVAKEVGRVATDGVLNGAGVMFGPKPSAAVDVRYETPKTDDKRPFRQANRITLSIRPNYDVTGRGILKLIENAYRQALKEAKLPLKDDQLDVGALVTEIVSAGGKRLLFEGLAGLQGQSPDEYVSGSNFLGDSLVDFKWPTQKLISFQFEDGRLTAVGLGDAETFSVSADFDIGVVEAGFGVSHDKQIVKRSYYPSPSFDSLVSKCDEFLATGFRAGWHQFAKANKVAFLRMAEIVSGNVPENDKNAVDDSKRFHESYWSMANDILNCRRAFQKERLEANLNRLRNAHERLQACQDQIEGLDGEEREACEQRVISALSDMLEATADHYNILESVGAIGGALGIDQTRNLNFVENADEGFVEMQWKGEST